MSSPLSKLIGSDPSTCKIITDNIGMHWFPRGAQPGDSCHCGSTTMKEHVYEVHPSPDVWVTFGQGVSGDVFDVSVWPDETSALAHAQDVGLYLSGLKYGEVLEP